jgi:hypothetical protein
MEWKIVVAVSAIQRDQAKYSSIWLNQQNGSEGKMAWQDGSKLL